jgi:hypothetical protein
MTINGEYATDGVVFGQGSLAATMQFYEWADQDHMPLKRIKVRWNDGSGELKKEGSYRNHKPICSTSKQPVAVCKNKNTGVSDFNHVCRSDKDCVDVNGRNQPYMTCSHDDTSNFIHT